MFSPGRVVCQWEKLTVPIRILAQCGQLSASVEKESLKALPGQAQGLSWLWPAAQRSLGILSARKHPVWWELQREAGGALGSHQLNILALSASALCWRLPHDMLAVKNMGPRHWSFAKLKHMEPVGRSRRSRST